MLDIGLIFARANARGFAGSTRGGVDEPALRLFAFASSSSSSLADFFDCLSSVLFDLLPSILFESLSSDFFECSRFLDVFSSLALFVFVFVLLVMVVRLTQGGFLDVSVGRIHGNALARMRPPLMPPRTAGCVHVSVEIQSMRVAEVGARL